MISHQPSGHQPSATSAAFGQSKDVVDIAIGSKDHTTLVAAVKAADLVTTLKSKGPFTVFAPTNQAFTKLLADIGQIVLASPNLSRIISIWSQQQSNELRWVGESRHRYLAAATAQLEFVTRCLFSCPKKSIAVTTHLIHRSKSMRFDVGRWTGISTHIAGVMVARMNAALLRSLAPNPTLTLTRFFRNTHSTISLIFAIECQAPFTLFSCFRSAIVC
jgi:hypothetical protein